MSVYAYIRVSSKDQKEDRQKLDMDKLEVPKQNLFVDKQSGKDFDRPWYRMMLKRLHKGD